MYIQVVLCMYNTMSNVYDAPVCGEFSPYTFTVQCGENEKKKKRERARGAIERRVRHHTRGASLAC